MAKSSDKRIQVTLECTECKRRNYSTTKNRRKSSERLEFSKFCRACRKLSLIHISEPTRPY